jgi:IclR family acetate operon transcriptional repressor
MANAGLTDGSVVRRPAGHREERRTADRGTVQSLERGIGILDYVLRAPEPPRLVDIAATFGIDKAAAFRLLATLARAGLVAKENATRRYTPGPGLLAWMALARPEIVLSAIARPSLVALAQATGHSAHLALPAGSAVLLTDHVPGRGLVGVQARVGVHEPLHCTAVGKAILAALPDDERIRILGAAPYRRFTPATLTTEAALAANLAEVNVVGFALDAGEFNPLIGCVGAPVIDAAGRPAGSLGISLLMGEIGGERRKLAALGPRVAAAAANVSAVLQQRPA